MEKRSKISNLTGQRFFLLMALVLLTVSTAFGEWIIDENFEGGVIPTDWTIHDADNDDHGWEAFESTGDAHSGDWIARVDCYESGGNDWIITPQLNIQSGDLFKFFAKSWYSTEDFNVKLSTTETDICDFGITLDNVIGANTDYVEYSYDLSAYAGSDVYLAIEWVQDTFAFVIDDVKFGQPEPNDVGMVSIDSPLEHEYLETEIFPSGTIMNYGTSNITNDFEINCQILNEDADVIYSSIFEHSGTIIPDETVSIVFPNSWIPDEIGNYYVEMITDLEDDANSNNNSFSTETEIVIHYGTGGADAFGYQWIDSTVEGGPIYDWIEICETGTSSITYNVDSFTGDDNLSEPINIGFDFPFYGIDRSYLYIDTNGEMLLADNTWYNTPYFPGWDYDGNMFNYMFPIPGYTQMPALIAAYWDDLHVDEGVGDIYFQTFGEAPNRYFVVEWHNVRFHAGTGGDPTLCFEVILHENGEIIFQYQNVANGQESTIPHDYGQSSTIAIQNDLADIGLCYLREIVIEQTYMGVEPYGNILQNEQAIRFFQGDDLQTPHFVYEEIKGNTFNNAPEVSVGIMDASGIASDLLYYDIGNGWESIAHSSFEEPYTYHYQLPEFPNSTTINYYFSATDNSENANVGTLPANAPTEYFTFNILPTEEINILLAHPGTIPGYQDYTGVEFAKFTMALDNAGVTYDIYNWAEYTNYEFPEQYETIFVYANAYPGTAIGDILAVNLMNFLDLGTEANSKNIFMASDDLPNRQHGQPNSDPRAKFYSAYLRGGYIAQINPPSYGGTDGIGGPDIYDYSDGSMIGMGGSPIGQDGVEIATYSNSPDVIYNRSCPNWYEDEVTNPEISSWGSFLFEDGPINGHAFSQGNGCGIWLDNLIYKSFFTSFDLSQIVDDNDINMIISDALNWFGMESFNAPQNLDVSELGLATWEAPATRNLVGYNIFLDDEEIDFTSDLSYQYTNLVEDQNYTAGISALYDDGQSIVVEFDFTYNELENDEDMIFVTKLKGNYPNPFNPTTTIAFSVANGSDNTEISIYNIKGQKVRSLVNEKLEAGEHKINWNGKNDQDKKISSGIYFYKLHCGNYSRTRKMIMLK